MIETCQIILIASQNSNTPLYPSIVLQARERAPIPCFSVVFSLGLTFESLKELGARHFIIIFFIYKLATYHWKGFKESYNFVVGTILIKI
jgi:hypothetical protein